MMKHRLLQSGLIAVTLVCLCLPAIHALTHGPLLRTDDGELHILRVVALDHAIDVTGALWPRYVPGIANGYGAPLFGFYPAGSYYLPLLLHDVGFSYADAWRWGLALYLVLAAGGAYLLTAQWSNCSGGFVGAAAYVYAPYVLFDAVTRGASAEVAALALLPWVLWGFGRLALRGQRLDFVLSVLVFACFALMHNVTTLYGTLILAGLCVFLWLSSQDKVRVFSRLFSAGVIGLSLSAFFLVPALLEKEVVRIDAVMQGFDALNVTNSLRGLPEIFSLPQTADPTRLNAQVPVALGWPQTILASVGLGFAFYQHSAKSVSLLTGLLACVAATIIFLNTPLAASVWRVLPLADYTWEAWRTLGIASLLLAWLAGISAVGLASLLSFERLRFTMFALIITLIGIYGFSWLYGPPLNFNPTSIESVQTYERKTGKFALASYAEYLPLHANIEMLGTGPSQTAAFMPASDNETDDMASDGLSEQFEVQASDAQRFTFNRLYTPAWRAEFVPASGRRVQLAVLPDESGLVAVDVEQGNGVLHVWLDDTPMERLGLSVTLLGFGCFLLVAGWFPYGRSVSGMRRTDREHFPYVLAGLVSLVGIILFAGKVLVVDTNDNILRTTRYDGETIQDVEHQAAIGFRHGLQLIAFEQPETIPAGNAALITLYWTVNTSQDRDDFSSNVTLRDANGLIVANVGSFMPGGIATRHWQTGLYVVEQLTLPILRTMPPGDYTLYVSLYDPETRQPLDVLNAAGNPVGVDTQLGLVRILRPDGTVPSAQNTRRIAETPFGFASSDGLPKIAQVGESFNLSIMWQAKERPAQDYQMRLVWRDADDHLGGTSAQFPLTAGYLTSQWQQYDIWQGLHRMYVPGALDDGEYSVYLQAIAEDDSLLSDSVYLGSVDISVPQRTYALPPETVMQQLADVGWNNGIRLLGYTWDDSVSQLTLWWQTTEALYQDLRLFVHLLDGDRILAQSDSMPADWTRPTTGWAVDEVIETQHVLSADCYDCTLRIGWYDPLTGERVSLQSGDDSFILSDAIQK
jgi:hypothetical protein